MVKKLMKYDFQSYLRLLLPVQLILIGIAGINRIVQIFEPASSLDAVGRPDALSYAFGFYSITGGDVYNIIFTSSAVLYGISVATCLIMTVIVAIIRFYQGMYSGEGYLNHTLPVTPTQHIFAKLLTSMLFTLGSLFAVFISFEVITLGDMNIEIFKALFYSLGDIFKDLGVNAVFYIIEGILLFVILYPVTLYLELYFCISVGQLVSRKKILLAFGVFFGLYTLGQIFSTILIIIFTTNITLMEQLSEWIADNGKLFAHLALCAGIVWDLILSTVFFLISRHIMSKRLNLT